ncbi:type II toxin-antitoxin system RelE/ParE family toxin [Erythrobacter sp. SN021]|jgi:addiction module RelE/StbE family toxin|uniref:type II toxin-antitoxin system RelE/ParE family toxin n=1 Tax=Erythrobacter TaxID=1041 RepID=UPI001F3787D1|nr:type II toxin-antitoxin system RelE/ParE family toxin [Erythrobacter sp. SN021]MCF8881479.1 type II toxin-antitoxin system RelE/ParE family toxin [Erythrobacter sp. SN021]
MLRLVWSAEALDDLDTIADYIGEHNPAAADRLIGRINEVAAHLVKFPKMHRVGRNTGTREAIISPNYLLIYRATSTDVEVLSVVHARQKYP